MTEQQFDVLVQLIAAHCTAASNAIRFGSTSQHALDEAIEEARSQLVEQEQPK